MNPMLTRRDLLRGTAALPFCLRDWAATPLQRKGRRLILVWIDGGMTHLDTFDCKPEAGVNIRGDLASIRGAVEGTFVSAHLPKVAARLDRCALIRSLTHGEGNHDRGAHLLLTGKRPSPVVVHPSLPAMLTPSEGALPAFVSVPDTPQYGGAGFLPASRGPFEVGGDPGRPDFAVQHLAPRTERARALDLLTTLDQLDGAPRSPLEADRDRFLAQARRMSQDPEVRAAFDLSAEPAAVRAQYGRHRLGQGCLLARRLVRAGVRSVLVRDTGWDHHVDIPRALTYGFPPKLQALDDALSALIDDLDQSGLGEETVVCLASEFGRTPRLNPSGGRDHWPRAQSVLLFGGGIRRGIAFGTTDLKGEEPASDAVAPADLFATLLAALGEDEGAILRTTDGRPVRAVEEGAAPIRAVLA